MSYGINDAMRDQSASMALRPCGHCGWQHSHVCPRIKAIEYYQDGTTKRVEYHQPVTPVVSIPTQFEPLSDAPAFTRGTP